ncbi:hypothetical protein MHH33_12800 [Paenisporosarcina sp. FSL H8-0542]|uniref:hypothetical protein n=1 Tax=Paenisporosarcina sp. FSL H8-0542 TaxID=2921401 RepID=UPI003159D1B7
MKSIKTVDAAKKEIQVLEDFVSFVENYQATTLVQKILKAYAYSGSIAKVVANMNNEFGPDTIDHTFVSNLLKSKPQDELHKRMKAHYLHKTRHTRKKPSKTPAHTAFQYVEHNYIGER